MNKLLIKCTTILSLCLMVLCLPACASKEQPSDKVETVCATVIEIEKYGHVVLDMTTAKFTDKGYDLGDIVCVRFDSYESNMPFFDGYYTNPGSVMLRGSSPEENIAVCINYGSFAEETGLTLGDTIEICLAEKAGMLTLQELCSLNFSNDRSDYSDDAAFANFRSVTVGSIGNGKLYRSSSPINNEYGRAAYADDLLKNSKVSTILNLADSEEDIKEYFAAEDFDSEYYLSLYESGKVRALDMTGDFFSDEFAFTVVEGLNFLAQNDPPYSIHCTEGKDRAGFTAMLLEAIMGATLQEIIDDYMLSFYNYYGFDKETEPERYEVILNNNLIAMLYHITDTNSMESLTQVDLESATTNYLLDHGMTENNILTLKGKLR